MEDLDRRHASSSTTALLVTIWEFGEAFGPLLIAPLSEVFGRYPVVNICNLGFILATVLAVTSQSSKVFIAARMLTGLSVCSNVLNPAIIGDMFESEKRGSAMSLIMLAPLIGGAVGPALTGFIAQTMGWRQILVISAGLAAVCELLFLLCFRETYKMAILQRRLSAAQREIGENIKTTGGDSNALKLWHAITRPFAVLFGSGVLLLLSLYASVSFSYFYVLSISLPIILEDIYGFTPAQTGSAFMSFSKSMSLSLLRNDHARCIGRQSLIVFRRWLILQRLGVQPFPRSDLYQTSRLIGRPREAGISSPTLYHWSSANASFYHGVWLDSAGPSSCSVASCLRSPDWVFASVDGHSFVCICC